jgi:hypothetical protein
MKRLLLVSTLLTVALSATATSSLALEVLADNLANTRNGGQSVNDNSWPAQAFTTTSTAFVLDSITLNMSKDTGATGSVELIVYDSSGTLVRPGTAASSVFATIDVSSLLTSPADVTISSLNVVLSPSTTYYLVLRGVGSTAGFDALWSYTNTTTGTGFPSRYSESNDGGATWDLPVLSSPQKMSINAVPEPSTYALAGLSAITVIFTARRRRERMA